MSALHKRLFQLVLRSTLLLLGVGALLPIEARQPLQAKEPTRALLLTLDTDVPGGPALTGSIEMRPYRAEGEPLRLPVADGETRRIQLPVGSRWLATAQVEGYWGRPELIEVEALPEGQPTEQDTRPIRRVLSLRPLGTLAGRLAVPRGEAMPEQVEIRLVSSPKDLRTSRPPRGSMTCAVEEKGAWSCPIPAGEVSIVLTAADFVPHHVWGQEVPPWKLRDLGTVRLQTGASLSGWVEVEGGVIDPETAEARLIPATAAGAGALQRKQIESAVQTVSVLETGFFQLASVPPGAYLLEVRQAGYSPYRLEGLELFERRPVALDEPVVLQTAMALQLSLEPARDWLDRPWWISIRRADAATTEEEAHGPIFEGEAPEGRIEMPGQGTGRYRVRVVDALDNPLAFVDWEVSNAETAHKTIEIEFVPVEGSVSLGDDPVPARLIFGGRFGAQKVTLEANEEGEFEGILPRAGTWRVDLEATEPALDTRVEVEVEQPREGPAEVLIELPDTEVFGRVVDQRERPMPEAQVTAYTGEQIVRLKADRRGQFRFRGLPEGQARFAAEAVLDGKTHITEQEPVSVTAESSAGPVVLQLTDNRTLTGEVASPTGPVAGALVLAGTELSWRQHRASTDLRGSFHLEVPRKTTTVQLAIAAPGHGLRALQVPVTDDSVRIDLSRQQGVLRIETPASSEVIQRQGWNLFVFQDGTWMHWSFLSSWARSQGSTFTEGKQLTLPGLAPGAYQVCVAPGGAIPPAALPAWVAANGSCDAGYLTAGGELTLAPGEPPGGAAGR